MRIPAPSSSVLRASLRAFSWALVSIASCIVERAPLIALPAVPARPLAISIALPAPFAMASGTRSAAVSAAFFAAGATIGASLGSCSAAVHAKGAAFTTAPATIAALPPGTKQDVAIPAMLITALTASIYYSAERPSLGLACRLFSASSFIVAAPLCYVGNEAGTRLTIDFNELADN